MWGVIGVALGYNGRDELVKLQRDLREAHEKAMTEERRILEALIPLGDDVTKARKP